MTFKPNDAARATATTGIEAVIDFPHIVIGGAVPETVLDEIVRRTADAYEILNTQGVTQPTFSRGTTGTNARATGAHSCPSPRVPCLRQANLIVDVNIVCKRNLRHLPRMIKEAVFPRAPVFMGAIGNPIGAPCRGARPSTGFPEPLNISDIASSSGRLFLQNSGFVISENSRTGQKALSGRAFNREHTATARKDVDY